MAQQSLYRRYRPRRFGEVKGQEHVVRALRNAVATESEGHAYLFSGPRGTGKTSTARILAKALNCTNLQDGEPCCECDSCVAIDTGRSFDLFELDAASNNGVDAVRELVERSAVGSPGRTKVYILDEVHMLTAAASNALLKTLEEPPEHVRFVLATTDPQKVLPTIRSRTQHFEFGLLSAAELEAHVRWVGDDAALDLDDDAVAHAVRQGRGSVRDTLSSLDQIVAAGGVLVRAEPLEQLFAALAGNDTGAAIVTVADALAEGHDPRVLAEAFLGSVRDAFLVSLGVETPHVVDSDRARIGRWADEIGTAGLTRAMERLGSAMIDMRNAADPRVPLEVALVQLTAATSEPASREATGDRGSGPELAEILRRIERLEAAAPAGPTTPAGPAPLSPAGGTARARPEAAKNVGGSPAAPKRRPAPPPLPPRRGSGASGSSQGKSGSATSPEVPDGPSPDAQVPAAPTPDVHVPTTQESPAQESQAQEPPAAQESQAQEPPTAQEPPAAQEPTAEGAPTQVEGDTAGLPDRDALVMAFGDTIVPQLPRGVARSVFAGGRFVSVTDGVAVFSVENAPTRDRAQKYRGEVERLLGDHFGVSVPLRLVTDDEVSSPDQGAAVPASPGKPDPPAPAEPSSSRKPPAATGSPETDGSADPEEAELIDQIDQLPDADVRTTGVQRLTDAFPGAELIEVEASAAEDGPR